MLVSFVAIGCVRAVPRVVLQAASVEDAREARLILDDDVDATVTADVGQGDRARATA